jgi:PAS domain S-box-containing protein
MIKISLLRRLIGWYALLFLALGLGVGAIYYQLHNLRQATRQKVVQYRSVQSTALRVEAELNYAAYLGYNYLLLDYKHISARAKGVWQSRLEVFTDSLGRLAQGIEDTETQDRVKQVRRDLVLLQEQWDSFFQSEFTEPKSENNRLRTIDKNFDLRLNKIRLNLLNIAASQESNLKFALQEIETSAERSRDFSLLAVIISFIVGVLITYILLRQVFREQSMMNTYIKELLEGDLPEPLPETYKETNALRNNLNELKQSFIRLKELADQVGQGEFDTHIRVFDDKGMLGKALSGMRESLQLIATENRRRNWFNEGYAQFSEILRNSQQEDKNFYEAVLGYLVSYINIQQGGIFVLENNTDHTPTLVLRSAYAFGRSKYPDKSFGYGEGLVGETWREGTLKVITDIPEKYAEITSGLGKSKPKCILLAPLITNEELVGVLELASFHFFEEYQIDFIKRVAESISATIARLKVDAETKQLLHESQLMAERMAAQEEENRQNMEVLISTQTKLRQGAAQMQAQLKALDNSFIRMELNKQGIFTKVNDLVLKISGYTANELVGKHFSILLGKRAQEENVLKEWANVIGGQFVKGEFVRYTKTGQKFWIYEVIYPVLSKEGLIEIINIVGYDITKQKEQEFKIKEQLTELQMSRRDVVNRIREVEGKARNKMEKMKLDFLDQLQEKERIIIELKSD